MHPANLGVSSGTHGAGFGQMLREQIIKDAFEIIQSGSEQPEIFHLVGLFEENVGPDRLSDMIARIIHNDIVTYSQRIYRELNISEETYPEYKFTDGVPGWYIIRCDGMLTVATDSGQTVLQRSDGIRTSVCVKNILFYG